MAKKTALITGAAGGIGTALAKRFAARHFNLALVDVARLSALVADVGLSNASALAVAADVSKEADVNEYVRRHRRQRRNVAVARAALSGAMTLRFRSGQFLLGYYATTALTGREIPW
jgi:NAD(P)-dependent dehydrogenase (short-subunit alcohol dehydrogenase family)